MRCLEIGSRLRLARESIGMSGRKTVSYTHLDVYKRQRQNGVVLSEQSHRRTVLVKRQEEQA